MLGLVSVIVVVAVAMQIAIRFKTEHKLTFSEQNTDLYNMICIAVEEKL